MFETEWFRIRRDKDAWDIKGKRGFSRGRYPYFMDRETFDLLDDSTAFYKNEGRKDFDDMIFDPTFMISDRFQLIFHYLEPAMEFNSVHLLDESQKEGIPAPLYWIPYLSCENAVHEKSVVIQGKAENLVLRKEALEDRRILHCQLPADDIWLFSLEAAECILRRAPQGIVMEKVSKE